MPAFIPFSTESFHIRSHAPGLQMSSKIFLSCSPKWKLAKADERSPYGPRLEGQPLPAYMQRCRSFKMQRDAIQMRAPPCAMSAFECQGAQGFACCLFEVYASAVCHLRQASKAKFTCRRRHAYAHAAADNAPPSPAAAAASPPRNTPPSRRRRLSLPRPCRQKRPAPAVASPATPSLTRLIQQ